MLLLCNIWTLVKNTEMKIRKQSLLGMRDKEITRDLCAVRIQVNTTPDKKKRWYYYHPSMLR